MTYRQPSSLPLIAALIVATVLHALFLSFQWSIPATQSTPALIIANIISASGELESQQVSTQDSDAKTDSMEKDAGKVQTQAGTPSPLATANAVSASPSEEIEALDLKKSTEKPKDIVLSKQSDIKEEKLVEEQEEAPLPINNTTANPETGAKQSLAGQTQTLSNPDKQLASDTYIKVAATWVSKHKVDLRKSSDNSTGEVRLKVTLRYGGVVTNVNIEKTSGFSVLDKSAKQSVLAASPFPKPPQDMEILLVMPYTK